MRLLIALLALFGSVVFAETVTSELDFIQEGQDGIKWTAPQQRVDGKKLDPLTEIASYELSCTHQEDPAINASLSIPGVTPDGIYQLSKGDVFPKYGAYNCTLAAVDTDGLSSDTVALEGDPFIVDTAAPMAPTQFILIVE